MKKIIIYFSFFYLCACGGQSSMNIHSSLDSALEDSRKYDRNILLVFDFLGSPTDAVKQLLHDRTVMKKLDNITVVLLNVDEPGDIGNNNRKLQENKYGTSTQPAFYLLDKKGDVIKGPLGYCSKSELLEFIE